MTNLAVKNVLTGGDVQECRQIIDKTLKKAISDAPLQRDLKRAFNYALFPGGKRIRPVLSLLLCKDLGGDVLRLAKPASALEIIHCASLIHDDLPAIDNDSVRRGRPSCHVACGEATAILTGDLMVAFAHTLVTSSGFSDPVKLKMIDVLSKSFIDLCNGQALDLIPAEREVNLKKIHLLKTGALFSATTVFAALASGANSFVVSQAEELGLAIGELYQLIDDYLDQFGSAEECGRPAGSDSRNKKQTLFNSGSVKEGKVAIRRALKRVDELLSELERSFTGADIKLNRTGEYLSKIYTRYVLISSVAREDPFISA
ncbi:MAG: polyprenyl synthetase family protein [Candidatus Dadabacteria bacterium]|nr:MAG: polyprenyl synthetase family protein [Candidatus Dadabacteria bacterium]